ncbi:MAG: CPBP family intramembrane metalloprotease [Verrucomicrobiales bacterium]|nr:CPBP family intramembrane metalloprotease [Verrucomicrobiales bacterium]
MDELAAKQVLLDFEIIALITLFAGVIAFALVRRRGVSEALASPDFDGYDLALMFFPSLLFLSNPMIEVMVAQNGGGEKKAEGGGSELGSLLVNIAYFFFVGVMTYGIIEWVRNRRVVELFGLKKLGLPLIVVYTILGGVASLVICAWALGGVSQVMLDRVFSDLAIQESVQTLQENQSALFIGLTIVMACVAAPVVEELLFRGYMYGALKRATNPVFAAVVIGALFAAVHGNLPALLPLWAFSILLCLAYEWSRSLWVPIGMHAFFNAANIVFMLIPSSAE